jgi:D-alanine-D-alanine ligase
MTRTIVGVLRGGTSNEYDLSLKTGAAILSALPEDRYESRDILIDRQGVWYSRGMPSTPAAALARADVILNAVHGGIGEDGTIGRILARTGIPYAGSTPHASSLAFHKGRARETLLRSGIRMPQGVTFTASEDLDFAEMANVAFRQFSPPYMVKPATDGASHGIILARTILELPDAIALVLQAYGAAVVEEFIRGHDASVGVMERFRGQDLYALPPAHMIAPQGSRFIHSALHRDQGLKHAVPSSFSHEEKRALTDAARRAHQALGLSHFSRADFVVAPTRPGQQPRVYLLEVNAIPGLYPGASFPPMLQSVGSSVQEFAEHAIHLAQGRV